MHSSVVPQEANGSGSSGTEFEVAPPRFAAALHSIQAAQCRPEVTLEEVPAPLRTAPYAVAIEGTVEAARGDMVDDVDDGGDDAFGRIIVLYDPDGQAGWHGEFRIVTTIKATLDPELDADPLLTEIAWSWVTEALDGLDARGLSGTVTQVKSASFGEIADDDRETVEIRASWSPPNENIGEHFEAWIAVLATAAGLEPVNADVTPISSAHHGSHSGAHPSQHHGRVRHPHRPALI